MNTARLFLLPVGIGLAGLLEWLAGAQALPWALLLGVAILGLPHGALDPRLAQIAGWPSGALGRLGFHVAYLVLAGVVVLAWLAAPLVALAAFLAIAAFHFGHDTEGRMGAVGHLGYGLLVVSLPIALSPETVIGLFAALGAERTEPILLAAQAALPAGALLLAAGAVRHRQLQEPVLAGLLALAAWWLHPLAYFLAYFCFLHSPAHLAEAAQRLGLTSWPALLRAVAPLTLASWLLAVPALPWLLSLPAADALLRLVFIGLAALTVPHMLLEWWSERRLPEPDTPGAPTTR